VARRPRPSARRVALARGGNACEANRGGQRHSGEVLAEDGGGPEGSRIVALRENGRRPLPVNRIVVEKQVYFSARPCRIRADQLQRASRDRFRSLRHFAMLAGDDAGDREFSRRSETLAHRHRLDGL
jgi:hypothetical protein